MADQTSEPETTPGMEEARATFIAASEDVRLDTPEQRCARILAIADDFMDRHDAAFRALAK